MKDAFVQGSLTADKSGSAIDVDHGAASFAARRNTDGRLGRECSNDDRGEPNRHVLTQQRLSKLIHLGWDQYVIILFRHYKKASALSRLPIGVLISSLYINIIQHLSSRICLPSVWIEDPGDENSATVERLAAKTQAAAAAIVRKFDRRRQRWRSVESY